MTVVEYLIDGYFEFSFSTQNPATGAAVDTDALPTYRVYEENNDAAVATGNCAKRDDAGTTGYYFARAQITAGAGYELDKDYYVEAIAIVGGVTSPPVPIGMFRVVPADVARDNVWTDGRATLVDNLGAAGSGAVTPWGLEGPAIFRTDLAVEDADHYKYLVCIFTNGTLAGQARSVAASTNVGGAMVLAFTTAFTAAPGIGDDFLLWPAASLLVGDKMDLVDDAIDEDAVAVSGATEIVATVIARVGAFTGAAGNTILGFFRALMRDDVAAPSDVGGDYDPATDSLETFGGLLATMPTLGVGARSIIFHVEDTEATDLSGVWITVKNLDDASEFRGETDTLGNTDTFRLDDGTYKITATRNNYRMADETVTITMDATIELEMTYFSPPSSSVAGICTCYVDFRYIEGGVSIGAGEGWVKIIELISPVWPDAEGTPILARKGDINETDDSGVASFDAVVGTKIVIEIGRPGKTDREEFTVPNVASYYIPLAFD